MTTATKIRLDDLVGHSVLIRDDRGNCRLGTLYTFCSHGHPSDRSQVEGWGKYDGSDRQWYSAGDMSEPETAWEFCFPADKEVG